MKVFDYQGKDFYLNNSKFIIRSGAIHYFRIPKEYWYDRLLKLKECGLNCVETYVAWNLHEPQKGEFVFDGNLDIGKYIDIAAQLGIYVIIRPGPYICAEWEGGGLPFWLLKNDKINIRCSDKLFENELFRYLDNIIKIVKPRLIENGGNILMLQIENEYGSYGSDALYLKDLKEYYSLNIPECIFFTSDSVETFCINAGSISNVLSFANYGSKVKENMELLEKQKPNQPLMCAEFWCGWFDFWGGEHHVRKIESIISEIQIFLDNDYSFNLYMFCGGTNFGFMNGANLAEDGTLQPTITSYDYGAPLSESGDRTELYYAIKNLIQKKTGYEIPLLAQDTTKKTFGNVKFYSMAKLFDNIELIGKTLKSVTPLSMEDMDSAYGYILYKTKLINFEKLFIDDLRDRALVYWNRKLIGTCERGVTDNVDGIEKSVNDENELLILVENRGRINFGRKMFDKKGISAARLWNQRIFNFECTVFTMDNLNLLKYDEIISVLPKEPVFYKGYINISKIDDTYLYLDGFSKGFAMINNFNIGRFDLVLGPQKKYYIPKSILKKGRNEIIIFDSDGSTKLEAKFIG